MHEHDTARPVRGLVWSMPRPEPGAAEAADDGRQADPVAPTASDAGDGLTAWHLPVAVPLWAAGLHYWLGVGWGPALLVVALLALLMLKRRPA